MIPILLFIGGPEIVIIMFVVVMLFGSKKIPEIARGLGKGIRELKDASNDIKEGDTSKRFLNQRRNSKNRKRFR